MDEIIDRLYQIELDANQFDFLNEKNSVKKQYDDSRKEYQQEAENKFANSRAQEHYDKERSA